MRPSPIISEPQITVHLVPTLSAIQPIKMPPTPEPSQATALASAGIERTPVNFGGNILERYDCDPCGAESHQHSDERHRRDGPGGLSFD